MFRKTLGAVMMTLAMCGTALAQDLPQLHAVVDVAAHDVLNIRAQPSARADRIGTLAHDATGIEVVALNSTRRWGQINTGEGTGWVAMMHLRPEGRPIDHFNLPAGLRCFGTEPFWSLSNENGTLFHDRLGDDPVSLEIEIAQDTGIADDLRRMILLSATSGGGTAYIHPESCSDGMSDRLFGLSIGFMPRAGGELLTGCCSLSH